MDDSEVTGTSSSLSKSKHISVAQFYKGTQVAPSYNTHERNKPSLPVENKYFEYVFVPKSRLLGVSKFIESVIKASRITVEQDMMQLSVSSNENGEKNKNVVCPESINLSEWIAAHIILFHNFANTELYIKYCSKDISAKKASKEKDSQEDSPKDTDEQDKDTDKKCNQFTCPAMTAGNKAEYLWADGKTVKQPTSVPAPKYIYHILEWTSYELNESGAFPRKDNAPYSDNFLSSTARRIIKRLFRVYAHFQYSHLNDMTEQDRKLFEVYLKQLLGLIQEYKLMDPKESSVLIHSHHHHHKKEKKKRKPKSETTAQM